VSKFYGKIGYSITTETEPGIWEETVNERTYSGDVTKLTSRYQTSNQVNDNITINNIVSIVADPYASANFQHIKYVELWGTKWKVNSAEIEYPRIILTLGGMYNENTSGTT